MECPRCHAPLPEVAQFCHVCGTNVAQADHERRSSFAAKPDESVSKLSLVSTIMPRGAAAHPQTYKLALVGALLLTLVAAIFGAMPMALMLAAFSIPVVYVVYLYDVNQWENEPVRVVLMAFALTFVLGLAWTWVWHRFLSPDQPLESVHGGGASMSVWGFLLFALVIPIVGEVIRQAGPVFLASRPQFDDLMDGMTFGVVSGVAYAAAETLITHGDLLRLGFAGLGGVDSLQMASLVFLQGFVKPLLYGTATGLAAAEFSGLGKGYDGFTGRYAKGLLWAIGSVAVYTLCTYLLSFLDNRVLGFLLAIVIGAALLALLIVRLRRALHLGLMEAAMEHHARAGLNGGELGFCPQCEMPLVDGSAFCSSCGASTRVSVRPSGRAAAPVATTTAAHEEGPA